MSHINLITFTLFHEAIKKEPLNVITRAARA